MCVDSVHVKLVSYFFLVGVVSSYTILVDPDLQNDAIMRVTSVVDAAY